MDQDCEDYMIMNQICGESSVSRSRSCLRSRSRYVSGSGCMYVYVYKCMRGWRGKEDVNSHKDSGLALVLCGRNVPNARCDVFLIT